ncbi:MAG: HAD-IIIC family phosphatase [Paludibacter sp.]|nr:HAD-IIIC family phosphatase [Paludibacter sp.]
MKKIDIKNIKLIIWDLDDTFWQGTISEEAIIPIEKNLKLIVDLTDCGVINSICSKNDEDVCVEKLQELGINDLFVFKSINWENKAPRIEQQIEQMALRPTNVLFIDDNTFNLQEVEHYLPEIQVAMPDVIDRLSDYFSTAEKTDLIHKRLKQYKLLEEKAVEEKKFNNNEEFLFASNIAVQIHNDCLSELKRLHEMILRTNQLNFTKKRISENELQSILTDNQYQCGYVTVSDKFGDYGIVGFYVLKDNYLEHFIFSCRTMGQGIEQYVYAKLNFPKIEISGEVRTELKDDFIPLWINQNIENKEDADNKIQNTTCKILLKGPCDLSKSVMYIKNNGLFIEEFTYVNDVTHNIIDTYNHSVHILGLKENDEQINRMLANDCIFIDPNMFKSTFFSEKYDVIFLSTIIESVYGIYRKKNTDIQVVFGDYQRPLTDKINWDGYISGEIYNANNNFTKEYLTKFAQNYEFIDKSSPEIFIERIKKILNYLHPETTLCLILGAEFPLDIPHNEYQEHILLNNAVREYAQIDNRLKYIEIGKIATTREDFVDTINHFTTRVYYEIALEILKIVNAKGKITVKNYSPLFIYFDSFTNKIRQQTKKIFNSNSFIYNKLRKIYLKISRKSDNTKKELLKICYNQ